LSYIETTGPKSAPITTHHQDFTQLLNLEKLDGILLANALHFVREQAGLLHRLKLHLKPTGRLLVVEYDIARGNPWVPFPVPFERLKTLAARAKLGAPVKVTTKPSRYHREMYVAVVPL
jgi:hypothetical protein